MSNSPTIIQEDQHKVNQAVGGLCICVPGANNPQPSMLFKSSAMASGATSNTSLSPRPSAASLFDPEAKARYLAALRLVRRIDLDLTASTGQTCNPSRHYRRRNGQLLHTLDEVVNAMLAYDLEVV